MEGKMAGVSLPIDNVRDRTWWKNVRLGTAGGAGGFDPRDDYNRSLCWFWSGHATRIYSRVASGERPRNALFWHLRNEEWRTRERMSRLAPNGKCDNRECINPFHSRYLSPADAALARGGGVRAVERAIEIGADVEAAATDNDRIWALLRYMDVLLDKAGHSWFEEVDGDQELRTTPIRDMIDPAGQIMKDSRAFRLDEWNDYLHNPIGVALWQRLLDESELTSDEAWAEVQRLRADLTQTSSTAKAELKSKWDKLAGATPAAPVKPRPRRRKA